MNHPSRKLFYAVEAVLYIAYNAARGPVSSRDIAEKQGLPPRYLEHIMQKLVHANILRGVRGPRGGYLLARERRRITVGEICGVLSDENEEGGAEGFPCTSLGSQIILPVWEHAFAQMMEELKKVSIAQLCEQAVKKNIRKESEERTDFTI